MRITALHIDGFGVLHDQTLAEVAPGLTVFHGANEAGKSTLLAFLRAMLYGFERADSPFRHEPLAGGTHGGWLEMTSRAGVGYRLDRHSGRRAPSAGAVTLTSQDGATCDAALLVGLLGGTTKEAYYGICAFSQAELDTLGPLAHDQVRGRIWTASMGGVDFSIVDIERQLDAERQKLYKARGVDWPINNLGRRLGELRKRLAAARDDLETYETEKRELESLEGEVAGLADEVGRLRQQGMRLEQYQRAWETWGELRADREELAALAVVEGFPPDGIGRLEELRRQQAAAAEEAREVADDLGRAKADREALSVDQALVDRRGEITALARGEQQLRGWLNDLPRVEGQARAEETHLHTELRDLGPDWDEARLGAIDLSRAVVGPAQQLADALRHAEEKVGASEREAAAADREAQNAQRGLDQEQAALEALPECPVRDAEEVRQRAATVGHARQALVDRQTAAMELEQQAQRRRGLEGWREAAAEAEAPPRGGPPTWLRLLLAPVLGGAVAALMPTLQGVIAGALVALVAGLVLVWSQRAVERARRSAGERDKARHTEAEEQLAALARAEEGARARLAEAEGRLRACSEVLGVSLLTMADVESAHQTTEEARDLLRRRETAQANTDRARKALVEAQEEQTRAQEARDQARRALGAAQGAWREWLAQQGLAAGMTPQGFRDLVEVVRRLREALRNVEQLRRRGEGMRRDIGRAAAAAEPVWSACGRPRPAEADLPNGVALLAASLQDALDRAADARALDDRIKELQARARRAAERTAAAEAEVTALLEQAGAADGEDFRRRGERHAQREALRERIAEAERALGLIVGFGEERSSFEAELEQINPAEVELQLSGTRRRLQEAAERQAPANQEVGARRRALEELETSQEIAGCLLEQGQLQEQLRELAEEYGTLSAALYLLRKTREKYERERQPAVVAEASRAMEEVTGGAYRRVIVPPDQFTVRLETAEGVIREIDQLSRGTQQQLYLAMRLAYATVQHRSPEAEPLPFVMDEVLVNFDPERARRAGELILNVAQSNQVLLFTCHPETVTLFRALEPTVPVVSVAGGQLRAMAAGGVA